MPTFIRSIRTTAGFLQNAEVEFAPGLTCVIGARGTCKSTLVETIRFAFHCNPERVDLLLGNRQRAGSDTAPMFGLIPETLRDGRVCCTVEERGPGGSTTLTVEREVVTESQVYREGVKELSDTSVLHRMDIYSQGDLQLIAAEPSLRLELIDRPHKRRIDDLKGKRTVCTDALRDLGPKIRGKRAEIESKRTELRALDELRRQLADLRATRPSLSEELDREREAFLRRKAFLQSLEEALGTRATLLGRLEEALGDDDDFSQVIGGLSEIEVPAAASLRSALQEFAEFRGRTRREVREAGACDTAGDLEALHEHCEGENARYHALRQDQQALNDSLKREDALKQQVVHLERLESEVERLGNDLAGLLKRRQECRDTIRRLGDELSTLRLREVEDINGRHSDVIILTLDQGARSPGYGERLSTLLRGSNLRNQPDVVRDLTEKVRPSDLIDAVESSDAARLARLLGRDLGQMTRLVSFLLDSPGLYELEGVVHEDHLEITMYDEGVQKPVNQLSKGQMATALLPLILRSADYPLLFDQPEDDLDNRFIYKTLIEIVRQLKEERQLIFVTHNANIPVLGEADRVIVMRMASPMAAAEPVCGTVDEVKEHILTLLEGGKEAFRLRQQKYETLLA